MTPKPTFLPLAASQSVCKNTCAKKPSKTYSWLPPTLSFVVVILPKCPFCLIAYTSTMAMCGASPLVLHHIYWGSWVALCLGSLAMYCIYKNYRGRGTHTALLLALIGLLLVIMGIVLPLSLHFYYIGSIILFFAAYYNASGFSTINLFFSHFKNLLWYKNSR